MKRWLRNFRRWDLAGDTRWMAAPLGRHAELITELSLRRWEFGLTLTARKRYDWGVGISFGPVRVSVLPRYLTTVKNGGC